MKNYYQILEVSQSATLTEIKSAFRRLSFKYHPDLNNADDAEENFKKVNEAYQILADPMLRQIYNGRLNSGPVPFSYRPVHTASQRSKKIHNARRNVIYSFLLLIIAFLVFEVSPSLSSVSTLNEYKANLSKKSNEYFLNSPEREKHIDIIIRRTNSLVDMFRTIHK